MEDLDKEQWWRVLLHNDEIHTFEYVIEEITSVVPTVTRRKAFDMAMTTHRDGQATVAVVWKKLAEQYCLGLQKSEAWQRQRGGLRRSKLGGKDRRERERERERNLHAPSPLLQGTHVSTSSLGLASRRQLRPTRTSRATSRRSEAEESGCRRFDCHKDWTRWTGVRHDNASPLLSVDVLYDSAAWKQPLFNEKTEFITPSPQRYRLEAVRFRSRIHLCRDATPLRSELRQVPVCVAHVLQSVEHDVHDDVLVVHIRQPFQELRCDEEVLLAVLPRRVGDDPSHGQALRKAQAVSALAFERFDDHSAAFSRLTLVDFVHDAERRGHQVLERHEEHDRADGTLSSRVNVGTERLRILLAVAEAHFDVELPLGHQTLREELDFAVCIAQLVHVPRKRIRRQRHER
eukprot:scaffold7601_cov267-Pinguiococcus_pyrenoidosus.AAC.2